MHPYVCGVSSWALCFTVGLFVGLSGATTEVIRRKIVPHEIYLAGIVLSVFIGFIFTGLITTFLLQLGGIGRLYFSFISGLLGGFVSFCVWFRKYDLLLLMNTTVPYLVLAHAFGRLGCLFYGCCFGYPSVEYGVHFGAGSPAAIKFGENCSLFPIQAVESALLFLLSGAFFFIQLRYRAVFYLLLYGICRFFLEFYRCDDRGCFSLFCVSLSVPQWQSVLFVILGIVGILFLKYKRPLLKNIKAFSFKN